MQTSLKIALVVTGIVGLVACFLPLVEVAGKSVSFWDFHEQQLFNTLIVIAGYGLGAAMGGMSLAKPPIQSWQSQLALAGFALAGIKFVRSFWDALSNLAVGGMLMLGCAVVGLIAAGVLMAKPETA